MAEERNVKIQSIIQNPQTITGQLFQHMDANSDGKVVKEEFLANGALILAKLLSKKGFQVELPIIPA